MPASRSPALPLKTGETRAHAQTWRDLCAEHDDIDGDGLRMIRDAAAAVAVALVIAGPLMFWAVEILVSSL
jgi:hypothetical protein